MSQWSDFYKSRVGDGYSQYALNRYSVLVQYLNSLSGSVREEGCGIGTITKLLHSFSKRTCMDRCPEMLQLAKMNNISNVDFQVGNILNNNKNVDVIFSHGVLEHFEDGDIIKIAARQRNEAGSVVHYVPTDGYSTPSFGDERLMSVDRWIELVKPVEYCTFNDGKDLMLVLR